MDVLIIRSSRVRLVLSLLEEHGAASLALRICDEARVDFERVFGDDRSAEASHPRQQIWAVLRWTLDMKLQAIGSIFRRDHTTVMAGIRAHQRRIEEEHPDERGACRVTMTPKECREWIEKRYALRKQEERIAFDNEFVDGLPLGLVLMAYVYEYDLEHLDDCPEDDTCECPLVRAISAHLDETMNDP